MTDPEDGWRKEESMGDTSVPTQKSPSIYLIPDAGDGRLSEMITGRKVHQGGTLTIAGVGNGMSSGKPSVMFCFELEDGSVFVHETSLALLVQSTGALVERYGDPTRLESK